MKNQQTKLNESSTRRRGFTVSQKSQMGKIKFKEKITLKKEKKIEKYLATNIAANIIALFRTVMTAFIRHHPPHSSSSFRMFCSFFFLLPFVFDNHEQIGSRNDQNAPCPQLCLFFLLKPLWPASLLLQSGGQIGNKHKKVQIFNSTSRSLEPPNPRDRERERGVSKNC